MGMTVRPEMTASGVFKRTIMPVLAGPVIGPLGVHYRQREVLIVRYLSVADAIVNVLPECFTVSVWEG